MFLFIGSVQDYAAASLPQYASGLYAPTLASNTLNATAALVAGKQIEGIKTTVFQFPKNEQY